VRGALEDLPGIEQMQIEFERREVAIRYDPGVTNVSRFIDAIDATGGYVGALRYGPIPTGIPFDRLLALPEDSLAISDTSIAHSAFTILDSSQFKLNLEVLQQIKPRPALDITEENYTVIYASLWTTRPKIIPYDWKENALLQITGDTQFLTPIQWIPLGKHIEDDGSGSEIGMLLFPTVKSPEVLQNSVLLLGQIALTQNNKVYLFQN